MEQEYLDYGILDIMNKILSRNVDTPNDINICYLLVGCYLDKFVDRGHNHEYPIIAERLHTNFTKSISDDVYAAFRTKKTPITIMHHILLIDPLYKHHNVSILPYNITRVLNGGDVDYDETRDHLCDDVVFDMIGVTPIRSILKWHFIPYMVPSHFISILYANIGILRSIANNLLIMYFDTTNAIHKLYQSDYIYTIVSNCELNYNDLITQPYITYNGNGELVWLSTYIEPVAYTCDNFTNVGISKVIEYVKRRKIYYYKEHIIPAIDIILRWLQNIKTIDTMQVTICNTQLITSTIMPHIIHRCGANKLIEFMIWYINTLKIIVPHHHLYLQLCKRTIPLITFIQSDYSFYKDYCTM